MAVDKKISELPASSNIDGTEKIAIVQDGETRQASIYSIISGLSGDYYLFGDESTDGSIRIHYNSGGDQVEVQQRASGVWGVRSVI